jgi:hypothetical protein
LIVLVILGALLGPMFYAGFAFSTHVPDLVALLQKRLTTGLPPFPEWLIRLPLIGPRIDEAWTGPGSFRAIRRWWRECASLPGRYCERCLLPASRWYRAWGFLH